MNYNIQSTIPALVSSMIAVMVLVGCGNSVEADGRKLAELQCKASKLAAKAQSGDMSVVQESLKLSTEAAELTKELESKYASDSDKEKLREAYLKAVKDCK